MSYLTQSMLAEDSALLQRVTACAAMEGITNPAHWAQIHVWQYSALAGWDAAYASAITAGSDDPGAAEDVITDAQILSGVQHLRSQDDTGPDPAE